MIARAETEVFLATNYWMLSEGTKLISNALRELSRKAVERQTKIVVKIMYDRGSPKQVGSLSQSPQPDFSNGTTQLLNNHLTVPPKDYSDPKGKIVIPSPEELPNIELEVVNYHRPIFGTFHSKYMVIDRNVAIIQSNNIQDNDNVEMMVQLEGPIVDSFYDVALISWHNELKPPLPCLTGKKAVDRGFPTFDAVSHATLFKDGKLVPVYQRYLFSILRLNVLAKCHLAQIQYRKVLNP